MIDYKSLFKACKSLKLDPHKVGENPFMDSRPLSTLKEPFDLNSIHFPKKELNQVIKIGQMIYNLRSQTKLNHSYDLISNKKGLKCSRIIEKVIPVLQEAFDFWLQSGLYKCKTQKEFVSHNGKVYEVEYLGK